MSPFVLHVQIMLILNAKRKEVTVGGNPSCHAQSPRLSIVLRYDSLSSPPPCREAGPIHGGDCERDTSIRRWYVLHTLPLTLYGKTISWDLRNRDGQHISCEFHKLGHKLMLTDRTLLLTWSTDSKPQVSQISIPSPCTSSSGPLEAPFSA